MAPVLQILAATLLASQASAHFLLRYPPTIGFDDDKEGTGPCGSFTQDANNNTRTDFHVGGDTVFLTNTHPTVNFLFRATTDFSAKSGWVNLRQPVQVNGLNGACLPQVTAPQNLTGQRGLIQVVANAPDGLLYQCAAVNFVSGSGPSGGSGGCTNSSGVTISSTSDSKLNAFGANDGSAPSSVNAAASSGSSSASPSATHNAASAGVEPMGYGSLGAMAWVVVVAAVSCAISLV